MKIDGFKWSPKATIYKYAEEEVEKVRRITGILNPEHDLLKQHVKYYDKIVVEGNILTTAGLGRVIALITGSAVQGIEADSVRLGVGDDATAASVSDAALASGGVSGANQYYRVMDSTYPTVAGGIITFKASFGNSEANYAWNCWGIDIDDTPPATSGGGASSVNAVLLNRKVVALGTKTTGTWVLEVTVTFQ